MKKSTIIIFGTLIFLGILTGIGKFFLLGSHLSNPIMRGKKSDENSR